MTTFIPYRLHDYRFYPYGCSEKDAKLATIIIDPCGLEDPNYDVVMLPATTVDVLNNDNRIGTLLSWRGWDWMIDDPEDWYDDWYDCLLFDSDITEFAPETAYVLKVSRQWRTLIPRT
jgi:hypothetical protein